MSNSEYKLIIAIVNRGFADDTLDGIRDLGIHGGTIINSRSFNVNGVENFLGIRIEPEKEMLFIIAEKNVAIKAMEVIQEKSGLRTNARGISFALPVDDVTGIDHIQEVIEAMKK